jgi:hypothetical protein
VWTTLNRTWKMGWWRRVGSNHRHHDYESCALPLSYAANSPPGLTQKLRVSCLRVRGCPGQDTRTSQGRRAPPAVPTGRLGARDRASCGAGSASAARYPAGTTASQGPGSASRRRTWRKRISTRRRSWLGPWWSKSGGGGGPQLRCPLGRASRPGRSPRLDRAASSTACRPRPGGRQRWRGSGQRVSVRRAPGPCPCASWCGASPVRHAFACSNVSFLSQSDLSSTPATGPRV